MRKQILTRRTGVVSRRPTASGSGSSPIAWFNAAAMSAREFTLVRSIAEYTAHDHDERSRQGIGKRLIRGAKPQPEGLVEVKQGLGGMLSCTEAPQ